MVGDLNNLSNLDNHKIIRDNERLYIKTEVYM